MALSPASSSDIDEVRSMAMVTSPNLRESLSGEVEVLEKKDVAENRGGVGA